MSNPNPFSRQGPRSVARSKPPEKGTRCTYYIDGAILCDAFPSWLDESGERRCAEHRGLG